MARAESPSRLPAPGRSLGPALAAAGALALGWSAWLLAPVHAPQGPPPAVAVLVDVSASITRQRPDWSRRSRMQVESQLHLAEILSQDVLVVAFARDVARLAGPAGAGAVRAELEGQALVPTGLREDASDVAGALAALESLVDARSLAGVRLLGDRSFTGADPRPALGALAARGVEVSWIAPGPPVLPDLAITRLDLPAQAEPGAALGARVWLALERGALPPTAASYELELELEGGQGRVAWSQPGELAAPASGPVAVWVPLGPAPRGTTRVTVRAVLRAGGGAGDAIPENDRAGGSVRAGKDLRALVVGAQGRAEASAGLVAELADLPGVEAREAAVQELAAALPETDVVVTLDSDLGALPAGALASFVRGGGGWLALAGTGTLAGWERAAQVRELLPLDLAARGVRPREIAILVDASGSMAGGPVVEARRAARSLADAVPAAERVVLRWFTDVLDAPIEVRGDAQALLASREAGGATDVAGALTALAAERTESAADALALLVTDGRDQQASDDELAALRARLAAGGIELVVVAVGSEADRSYLARLAGPGGRLVEALDPEHLRALFVRAALGRQVRSEGPYGALFGPDASGALALDAASPRALGRTRLPSLEGYLVARARPGAALAWVTEAGEPLLGLVRRERGATALFGSLPTGRCPGWATSFSAAHFEPLVRWLGRGRPERMPTLVLERGVLTVEDVPDPWPLELWARAVAEPEQAPDGGQRSLLRASASALGDPRGSRAGPWPWPQPRGARIEMRASGDSGAEGTEPIAVLSLAPTTPEEFLVPDRSVPEDPGSWLASIGAQRAPARPAAHPLGAFVLGLGLVLVAAAGLAWGRR